MFVKMKLLLRPKIIFPIIWASLFGLAVADATPAISAYRAYAHPEMVHINEITSDIKTALTCRLAKSDIDSEKDDDEKVWRACVLDVMPKLNTPVAARSIAIAVAEWMETHPEDTEIRASASELLQRTRLKLLEDWPTFYQKMETLEAAWSKSVVTRTLWPVPTNSENRFDMYIRSLDSAEAEMFLPDLLGRQRTWRNSAQQEINGIKNRLSRS